MSVAQKNGARVLVVDDHESARIYLRELLEPRGYRVLEASNGWLALESLHAERDIALVLLDLEMPVMTGAELLQAMRANKRLAHVPVVVISGRSSAMVPWGGPVVGYFPKPFEPALVLEFVKARIG